jgi:hypothetical protein
MSIPDDIQAALNYSRNFATAKPNIGLTEKEHIIGLANLLEKTALELSAALPQPAAHLAIPGALELDGDNGTHGADGESRAHGDSNESNKVVARPVVMTTQERIDWMSKNDPDLWADWMGDNSITSRMLPCWMTENGVPLHAGSGESSAAIATLQSLGYAYNGGQHWKPPIGQAPRFDLIDDLRTQLASTEQSRRSFFDLSQDLEKRLAERDALLRSKSGDLIQYAARLLGAPLRELNGLIDEGSRMTRPRVEAAVDFADSHMKDVAVQIRHIADALSAITKPAKPKTCIECDQPYCHGVCVERGDQDYDRDQAAKGGEQ